MPAVKDPLIEASLDLAWAQWGALGIRSSIHGGDTAVDLEALVHFTVRLVDADPRLADEVRDWLAQYDHFVSGPRLNALARVFDTPPNALSGLLTRPLTRKDLKSSLTNLETLPRSLLRLRSVFGGNARADVLLHMLTSGEASVTALDLTPLGMSKRTAAEVLEGLSLGGIVKAQLLGNRLVYRLADEDRLRDLLGPLPEVSGQWHLKLPLVARFIALSDRVRHKDPIVQAVETQKLMEEFDTIVNDVSFSRPPPSSAETQFATVNEWLANSFIEESHTVLRSFSGLIEGVWLGPLYDDRRFLKHPEGALLPRDGTGKQREFLCLDLVQTNVVGRHKDWMWTVLSSAAEERHPHSKGLLANEAWRFVPLSAVNKVFDVSRAEPLPADQIAKLYGSEAAARARKDRPAIQYKVRLGRRHTGKHSNPPDP